MNKVVILLMLTAAVALLSCGGTTVAPPCAAVAIEVHPTVGTADHMAAAPGDSVQFNAVELYTLNGTSLSCPIPAAQLGVTDAATWTVSDAVNVRISNAAGTQGMATCVAATNGPVTVTATAPDNLDTKPSVILTGTATLTCN